MIYYGTIGPACADPTILSEMLNNGMTGIRLNLSHGTLKDNMNLVNLVKDCLCSDERFEDFLIDLQGPELRIGDLREPILLEDNIEYLIPEIPKVVVDHIKVGQELLFDDGKIAAVYLGTGECDTVSDETIHHQKVCLSVNQSDIQMKRTIQCVIKRGGILKSRKSIAIPGVVIDMPTLTSEDLENISMASECGVTSVMLPFVRNNNDIKNLRTALNEANAGHIKIHAKIESMEGYKAIEEFMDYADHIVIARGDLGNAVPLWELPGLQRRIEDICRKHKKPYMVVTQMLNSMIENPVPTRAEVNDIYLAVYHGAASIMLTGETAAGRYPVEAMRYMVNTGNQALKDLGE